MKPATAGPLERLHKDYEAAYGRGDASALADLYTNDAVLMAPDAPTGIGPANVKSYYQPRFDHFNAKLAITIQESGMLGDWGFARGEFTATLAQKTGGSTLERRGKYAFICAVQPDGSWKIARHIWSVAVPFAGARR